MNLANSLTMAVMYVAVLGVGCVHETRDPDDAPEAGIDQSGEESEDGEESYDLGVSLPQQGWQGDATVVGVEILDVTLPAAMHPQGIAVPAKLARPKWSQPVGKGPAVMVLHGSGGLLKMPSGPNDKPCSSEMEPQFQTWATRLAKLGYVVLLPSSYSARGFCDKHDDTKRMPSTFDEDPEQILGRVYDVDVAARYMCARPEIDCERMGVLGFSQGGTMTMIALHWQIEHALQYFRATKGDTVDIEIPDVAPGRPDFRVGIAYYPGCGFDGFVPLSTSAKASIFNKYFATSSLTIQHGSADPLVTHCSVDYGPGEREIQSGQVAAYFKVADTYDITVYPNAGHSFDYGTPQGGTKAGNAAARDAALAVTLARLAKYLQ